MFEHAYADVPEHLERQAAALESGHDGHDTPGAGR